jgi:hypothetical protein
MHAHISWYVSVLEREREGESENKPYKQHSEGHVQRDEGTH